LTIIWIIFTFPRRWEMLGDAMVPTIRDSFSRKHANCPQWHPSQR
jgi:hypothetical protein